MTERLLRVAFTGAYLVLFYFFVFPIFDAPRLWKGLLVGALCFLNVFAFWASPPKSLRLTLGILNAVVAAAVLVGAILPAALGKAFFSDRGNVVMLLYFLVFVPALTSIYLFRIGTRSASHGL